MQVNIDPSWEKLLRSEFEKDYFITLTDFVRQEYTSGKVFPPGPLIFNAFNLCPIDNIRVVILGQDPYHGENQAHGLSFSVKKGIPKPPSLQNIFKELQTDLNIEISEDGDLTRWAKQGVFLLNSVLTVRKGQAGSHQGKGWELFTDEVIRILSREKQNLVFMLWGNYARNKKELIDGEKHLVLEAAHPSPFSAHNGFFGCKHFSIANEYLAQKDLKIINW